MNNFFRPFVFVLVSFFAGFQLSAKNIEDDYKANLLVDFFFLTQAESQLMLPPPTTDFTVNSTNTCVNSEVIFTDISLNTPTSWSWVFSGGTPMTSTQQNPTVTYSTPGLYPVILIATNTDGSDTIIKHNYIQVNDLPVVNFENQQNQLCADSVLLTFVNIDTTYAVDFTNNLGNTIGTNDSVYIKQNGNYTYTITDTNGCSVDSTFFVHVNDILIQGTVNNMACSNDGAGTIDLTLSGGMGDLTVEWSDTNLTGLNLTNLDTGLYTVTVTDTNLCSRTQDFIVSASNLAPIFNTEIIDNGVCADSAIVNLTNLDSVYSVEFENQAGTILSTDSTFIIKQSGTYTYTVTDTTGCSVDSSFFITVNDIVLSSNSSPNDCYNTTTGSIDITATGGQGDLTIEWSDTNLTGFNVADLDTGMYIATIQDTLGCFRKDTFQIVTQFPKPEAIFTILNNAECADTVTLAFTNLDSTYTVSISDSLNNVISTDTLTKVSLSGEYSFQVIDTNGCTIDSTFSIEVNDLVINSSITHVTCLGGNDGQIILDIDGGVSPLDIEWNMPELLGDTISDLDTGIYYVTITDANSCTRSDTFEIISLNPLPTGDVQIQQNTTCDDSVLVYFTNIDPQSSVSIFDTSNTVVASGAFTYLYQSGEYTYSVTDTNGCVFDSTFTVVMNDINITSDVVNNNCTNTASGSIELSVEGGQGNLTFDWTPAVSNTHLAENLAEGTYYVTVSDTNNCSVMDSFEITTDNTLPQVLFVPFQFGNCSDSVLVQFINIDTTYEVEIFNGDGIVVSDTSYTYLHESGNYSYVVTDTNGCTNGDVFQITLNDIEGNPTVVSPTCLGIDNGSITLNPSGGAGNLTLEWADTNYTTSTITNLSEGTYVYTITDTNNCSITDSVVLNSVSNIEGTLEIVHGTCSNQDDASLYVNMTIGFPPYSYDWSFTVLDSDTLEGTVPGGDHTLTVTDQNGCIKEFEFTVESGLEIIIQHTSQNVYCAGDSDGSIQVFASGGHGPYTYLWNDNYGVSSELNNIPAGDYSVEVTDTNGCTGYKTITIIEESVIDITADVTPETCPYTNDGKITVSMSGGVPPYSVEWEDTNVVGTSMSFLNSGFYTAVVTGADGCVMKQTIEVPVETPITSFFVPHEDTVYLDEGGYVKFLNYSQSATSFSWSFGDGIYSTSKHITHNYTDVGEYYVTLTSFKGICEMQYTVKITVIDKNPLVIDENEFGFEIYPNPNKGEFIVDINAQNKTNYQLLILDALGKRVFNTELSNGTNKINTQGLSKGIYFIHIQSDKNRIKLQKMIVE